MSIIEIESAWRETGIICPHCIGQWMTYSDGKEPPQCSNPQCLKTVPLDYVWKWLITLPEYRGELRVQYGESVIK